MNEPVHYRIYDSRFVKVCAFHRRMTAKRRDSHAKGNKRLRLEVYFHKYQHINTSIPIEFDKNRIRNL